ncbi:MAG: 3-hydroxyacyl-CoA dehydrogenase NAD-binding domain-containing protein [Betaproteobacteria bacterium]|nr:3-hydroxyacyl-CoA dehydrogenase NAD-binding domain-containing protein [Betaproteobacteria bacterium]
MSDVAAYTVRDGIAVITLNNPPVNGLGNALRAGIAEGLEKADSDPDVKAVVLIGSAKAFSGGADIREFNKPTTKPTLPEVNDLQDSMQKPLVAAIGGFALGGGLELALGCHYRVALEKSVLGLPEVKLGILPGSGGTQRLPRIIPVHEAARMMILGDPIPAKKAKELGLVDEIVSGDLLEAGVAYAQKLVAEGKGTRRVRDMPPKVEGDQKTLLKAVPEQAAKSAGGNPAPAEIAKCIHAAVTLPFDEGRKVERERFEYLVNTVESKALRHMFFAERQTSKIPDVPESTPTREIKKAAVVGAGTMGGGIAMSFANAGIPVVIADVSQEALDKGMKKIRDNYESTVRRGRLKPEDMEKRYSLIQPSVDLNAARPADIVIEAVFERMDVKQEMFKKLDAIMKPGAILATNTSTLDINKIAEVTKRPQDVIGTHFFSPANVMRLLEVVRGEKTAKDVLATTMKLGKKLKKVPIVSGVCDGFIGNRMIERYSQQAGLLLDEGASPQQVDAALQKWGMAMGPFTMSDLAGNDIGWDIRKRRYYERPDMAYSKFADKVCELGRFGQKTGTGFYRYEPGNRKALPDPEIDALLDKYRKEHGLQTREIADEEIVGRCIFALVNAGARILEEGIALRASDIDMVYLAGYGFPAHRGGPMFYADTVGLPKVLAAIEQFQKGYHGKQWQPAPLLVKLAKEGKRFNE